MFFLPFSNIFLLHSLLPSIFKVRIYRSINIKYKYVNVWFMSFGQGVECQNWCWMSNICYCELTQKRSYLGICTSFRSDFHVLKKSKQKFNIKFVIWRPVPKIQQTKMLVTCQRFGDWFLFGLVWPYSSIQKNIMKVGSKSLLLTCSSNKLWAYLYYIFLIRRES